MPRRDRTAQPLTPQQIQEQNEAHQRAIIEDEVRVSSGRRSRLPPPITREMYRAMIPRNENPSSLVVPVNEDPCEDPC
jgi:hypothetical protein